MVVRTQAASYPAPAVIATDSTLMVPPDVPVPAPAPVAVIDGQGLKRLQAQLATLFEQYKRDRSVQEQRWLRNLRQYLGYYDNEVLAAMAPGRSQAYPKITRVKCISMKARIMDLMFPSDDRNWTLEARPSPDMAAEDVKQAIADAQARDTAAGGQPPVVDQDYVMSAVQDLASKRAEQLTQLILDQLEELGGDQTYSYVALNGEVVQSGIRYGLGVLTGPFAREVKHSSWQLDPTTHAPVPKEVVSYMPQFEFLRCWDYYPDMTAKRLEDGDGWFSRVVMSRHQLRKLADRSDFMGVQIKAFLELNPTGNYKATPFETELRSMGTREAVNDQKPDSTRFEVIVWHGPIDGHFLRMAGVEVAEAQLSEDIDAEVWTVGDTVIKAVMNPWTEMGMEVRTVHHFLFDHDDTSPIGFGLPNVLRDTQMSISASTRMMLDNASVVCGPILEMNTNLLRADQDLTAISAYKIFYRDDDAPTAQFPAVRNVEVNGHIAELQGIIKLFMEFADIETFVGPATGGDMSKMPSEPMRNAAGASMLLGNAALPFKEIIREFDKLTASVMQSLVQFNRKFNPDKAQVAAYDVIARGATSLIAKEMRGMQIDSLVSSMTPEEKLHIDERKMVAARLGVRDLKDMLVSPVEAARRKAAQDAAAASATQLQQANLEATTRKLLSDAFKNIAAGQKNQMGANAMAVETALEILRHGLDHGAAQPTGPASPQIEGSGATEADPVQPGQPDVLAPADAGGGMVPAVAGEAGGMPGGGLGADAGAGQGL